MQSLGLELAMRQELRLTAEMRLSLHVLAISSADLAEELERFAEEEPLFRYDRPRPISAPRADDVDPLARVSSPLTLAEALKQELRLMRLPEPVLRVALYLADDLDERGYLAEPLDAVTARLGVTPDVARAALDALQSCDPPGVGAEDLESCLLLQLRNERAPIRSVMEAVIRHHLVDLAEGRLDEIAAALSTSRAEVEEAVRRIRRLHPAPAAAVAAEPVAPLVPDVIVRQVEGEWSVEVTDWAAPRLELRAEYRHLVQSADEEARRFVSARLKRASWWMRAIERRRMTLQMVAQALVRRQTAYLERGPVGIRPLRLADIADEIGVHESTVSRAVKDKILASPQGLVRMERLFSVEVAPGWSQEAAKARLAELVRAEDKANPLSDQAIANLLAEEGCTLSRRAIAKYREALGIPNSFQRKR
ncbi:RNA polymerase factor sigma-54 [Alicyclobacillus vulcanalis]|uniref:RNA polymerase, sigma 54 subunit, RpoN/SigL n=1 Tax=Alicyclobacillus vulcanalis TaxID=252246 RepID=A0A1N7P335_9BACL|nr:RNA polymerase factor sigma-54 [Alicyclobacillus vulcanalis]SIT04968.1 RNA polymerase, sigma 54 subunit, RpoN/SigL [Alicyclobacillus vulcanalis]